MAIVVRLCYRLFLIILLFSYGLIIAAGIFPVVNWLYPVEDAGNRRDKLKMHWLRLFSRILCLDIIVDGDLPRRGTLLASNHISWLDIIVIGRYLPAYFVAKSDISGWPVVGYLARQAGTIFIRRGDKRHIQATAKAMAGLLRDGRSIIAFPEGTTTCGDEVLHFHSSLFEPALSTQSAIQPVALQYYGEARLQAPFIGDDAFVPHLIRMLALDRIEARLSFLPVIDGIDNTRHAVGIEARDRITRKISSAQVSEPLTIDEKPQAVA
ncbi:lysophospholipid acyltransferase family protein [Methylobacter sp. YRD-M1]|uniref:lysophospholipid acyltransferase family protein n=1 Tax=Methylobacter sp. YRD-M1 TaxID=2911520 RepID=UPI00227B8EB3|nr:lysophospholipid acyltransferase family protein [Methylobacter sp. YRD-M1]WAK02478.1 1-acyl-sn-glycerol-3-phosphate acyltransferase [Methylobacter sp. YRD-M1]